jgi:hypothetical protein
MQDIHILQSILHILKGMRRDIDRACDELTALIDRNQGAHGDTTADQDKQT